MKVLSCKQRRARWRTACKRALAVLVIMNLALAVFMFTNSPAHAATWQALSSHNMRRSSARSANVPPNEGAAPCSDPKQITLDCLSQSGTPAPANKVQNPLGDGSALFFFTDPSVTYEQPLVLQLWAIMLGAVDVCVVLALILDGIQIMVAGTVFRYAQALESIPGALLGLVAAHVSLILVIFFLSLNNVLSVDLYNWANANAPISLKSGVIVTEQTRPTGILPIVCMIVVATPTACVPTTQVDGLQITPQNLDFTNMLENVTSLSDMLLLIVKVLELMLLAQVIIRIFFIDLYIVLMPAALGSLALPGKAGYPVARLILHGFSATVFTQFCQVSALIVVELIVPTIFSELHSQLTNQIIHADALVSLCKIGALWFVFRIPALLDEAPTRTLMAAGEGMVTAVVGTITSQVALLQLGVSTMLGLAGIVAGFAGSQQEDSLAGGSGQANTGQGGNPAGGSGQANTGQGGNPAPARRAAHPLIASVPGMPGQGGNGAATVRPVGSQVANARIGNGPATGQEANALARQGTGTGPAATNEPAYTGGQPASRPPGGEVAPDSTTAPGGGMPDLGPNGVDGVEGQDYLNWRNMDSP